MSTVLDGPFTYSAGGTVAEIADRAERTYAEYAFSRSPVRRPFFKDVTRKAKPQATAFLRVSDTIGEDAQKLSHLQVPDQTRTREFIEAEAVKRKKYAIETGFDEKTQSYRAAPLEPWTGPKGSQRIYQRIMFATPVQVGDYAAADLPAVEWMREEGLAGVDDDGFVRPLSDSRPSERRAYPGAPVSDGKAKIGRTLRQLGRGLVLAAMANLFRHLPVSKIGRRKLALAERRGGMSLSAYDIATEANAIKAKRHDLADYRYLSVSTVRSVVKELLEDGALTEAEPPKALRAQRTWRTLPRVFAEPPADLPEVNSRRSARIVSTRSDAA